MKSIKVKYSFITTESTENTSGGVPTGNLFIEYVDPGKLLDRIALVKKDIVHELIKKLPDTESGILGGPLNRNKIFSHVFTHDTFLDIAARESEYYRCITIVVDLPIELISEPSGNRCTMLGSDFTISDHEIKLAMLDDIVRTKINQQIVNMIKEGLGSINTFVEHGKAVAIYSSFHHGRVALAMADINDSGELSKINLPSILNYLADNVLVVSFTKHEEPDQRDKYNMSVRVLRSKTYDGGSYISCDCFVMSEDGTLQYSEAV